MSRSTCEVTDCVLETFFDSSRSSSFMLRKSMFPPTLSWHRAVQLHAAVLESLASTRCVMVAPTWLLMSSPMIGTPAIAELLRPHRVDAMKTGRALTNATPASSAACA